MVINWSTLVETMRLFGQSVYGAFNAFLSFLNTPLIDVVYSVTDWFTPIPILADIINKITEFIIGNNDLATMPIWGTLLGGGVVVVAIISFIKWLIGIIT